MWKRKQGIFAMYKGKEYEVLEYRDINWETAAAADDEEEENAEYCIFTEEPEKADETFVYYKDWKGYRKHIEPKELENVERVRTYGILNGYTVGIWAENENENKLLACASSAKPFEGYKYRNPEPGGYEAWIDADEIEVVIVSKPFVLE